MCVYNESLSCCPVKRLCSEMMATEKDLDFHMIITFGLLPNKLSCFICAPETCFLFFLSVFNPSVEGDIWQAPKTETPQKGLGFLVLLHSSWSSCILHREISAPNQPELSLSVCLGRWTSFSRSTWCRETSPRRNTACETWRSLTSTTSWCTRCVGRDSHVCLIAWMASRFWQEENRTSFADTRN